MTDKLDYTIIKTDNPNEINRGEYILYNGMVYKIDSKRCQRCGKKYISITFNCYDFIENKRELIKFLLDDDFFNGVKLKSEINKINFIIKNGTFIDYNDGIISFLDETDNAIDIKYDDYKPNEDQVIKYIKYGEDYKINHANN